MTARIAIVGYAARLPGSQADLGAFWRNVSSGVDCARPIPAGRWILPPERVLDPRIPFPDSVPTDRSYTLDPFAPDLDGLKIDPGFVGELDPLFHLFLDVGNRAWRSAKTDRVDPSRCGVIAGNICLPTDRASDLARHYLGGSAPRIHPLNRSVAGLPAGLLARALGLGAGAFTLDAACASSLYAIKLACDELLSGRADAMLAGGSSRPDSLYTQMGFAQLRALSPSGRCAPFDAAADGLMVGEGACLFVLKHLDDARRAGDTIHATLAGWGLSNDRAGNLLAPAKEGQLRAMRAAYSRAGWKPSDVDLIECHATGTPVGDAVEFESLRELWRGESFAPGQCALGSVKSTVGHLLTGAGSVALLKVVLALANKTRPPQANFREAAPNLPYANSPFQILQTSEPWNARAPGTPRRAAVSGFGFGGVNGHLLIEEDLGPKSSRSTLIPQVPIFFPDEPIAIVGLATQFGSLETVERFRTLALGGNESFESRNIDRIAIALDRFRIPPKELEELLPQQLLMLRVAALALDDAQAKAELAPDTGVFLGLGLDLNTTNFHLRWAELAHGETPTQPPLTADRTMGALGSIAASRIARAFGFGGPSFTSCSEESSGLTALQLAVRALRLGEIPQALVGSVDLTCDPRVRSAAEEMGFPFGSELTDGAVAFVLKRLSDAKRDGDTVYAYISGMGSAVGGSANGFLGDATTKAAALARACSDAQVRAESIEFQASELGHTGFASGLFALARAALALKERILPDSSGPRCWLADRGSPRRASVTASSTDGTALAAILEEGPNSKPSSLQPLGARPEALFAFDGGSTAELLLKLEVLRKGLGANPNLDALAREQFRAQPLHSSRKYGLALVASSPTELADLIEFAEKSLKSESWSVPPQWRDRAFFSANPLALKAKLAFVFPGSGNQFAGMGRELGAQFPTILERQQSENARLRSQYSPDHFLRDSIPPETTSKQMLFGQVSLGTLVSDLLISLGLKPEAMLGQSLGESAGLFGMRVWRDRDLMLERIEQSTLFGPDLGPPYNSAREEWGWPKDKPLDWLTGVVTASADDVNSKLRPSLRAYLLIVNTPNECVIGGLADDVTALVKALGKPFLPLSGVTLAHCEAGKPVEGPYRELHTLPVTAPPGMKIFSGAWGRSYPATSSNAAESITAGLTHTIDFPAAIEAAYRDGVRAFIEVGPGASCTRMIGAVLADRAHLARAVCANARQPLLQLFSALAACHAERIPFDLSALYGQDPSPIPKPKSNALLVIPVVRPVKKPKPSEVLVPETVAEPVVVVQQPSFDFAPFVAATLQTQTATAEAHNVFLRIQNAFGPLLSEALQVQNDLIRRLLGEDDEPVSNDVPRSLNFEQCTEFAVGKIGNVLGPLFAEIDSHPTRVRLPEGPLMLVDAILNIEGEPKSMGRGRVITEHTVHAERWYLDNGRCPTSVTVESGQADLFLAGFLGIDFQTKGLACYRLLDAVVSFHRGLPKVGERIEYDIRIDEFFHQADSWLFRFRFEGTVNGEPLLSMQNGVAGFFTAAALNAGQGIIHTKLDKQPMPGVKPDDWAPLVPFDCPESLDASQVQALHRGDLVAAYGEKFHPASLKNPVRLPSGMLRLVDRVPLLDPTGGRFGLGFVRAEYDIQPREWFIECHFVDDKVMPGTLMYECCLHTLRTLLHRFGWVYEESEATCEPVPGVQSRLKCRGQVLDTTKLVTYEVSIKELGYRPEPYCIADALMYADGKPIVEITSLSIRLTGLSRERLEAIWGSRVWGMGYGVSAGENTDFGLRNAELKDDATVESRDLVPVVSAIPYTPNPTPQSPAFAYGPTRIHAYSNGLPSEAFGEPYRIFDQGRIIARLPGPPYQFLDGITKVEGEPFVLQEGAACEALYAVPADGWYFEANRCGRMPFSILLEIALQPCGWLAAYCGSALTSPTDLSFRNLGGEGKQFELVGPDSGTLTTNVKMTKLSKSAGMIIQHYDLLVTNAGRKVYEGTTYFGFFAKEALTNQVGMPTAKVPYLTEDQAAFADKGVLPTDEPFPAPMLRMIDKIDGYLPRGGKNGLGLVQGRIAVDPSFWFFSAHFYQDPVWPGSLGLESFLQLLKYVAWKRWKFAPPSGWQTVALNRPHSWTYRGQVVPTDREVTVVLEITNVDETRRTLTADGFLTVDGRIIYQMKDFTLE